MKNKKRQYFAIPFCFFMIVKTINAADPRQQSATSSTASTPGGQPYTAVNHTRAQPTIGFDVRILPWKLKIDPRMGKELTPQEFAAYKAALHKAQNLYKDPIPEDIINQIATRFDIPPQRVKNALINLC